MRSSPFVNRKALGGVAGIVGAGGNVGAVAAGFLIEGRHDSFSPPCSCWAASSPRALLCALAVRFTHEQKLEERRLYRDALAARAASAPDQAIADGALP